MEIRQKIIDMIRDKRTQIPTLPVVVDKILKAAGDEHTTSRDLAGIISTDQGISNKTLKLANSSYYGLAKEIDSISRAITIIGFNEIVNLTLGMTVLSTLQKRSSSDMLDIENLWIHAIGCGLAAKEISIKIEESFSDQIFLAGLLHDTGKLILALYFSEEYGAVLDEAQNSQISLPLKETEILGLNHAEMSGLIMERWNFPDKIRVPAHFHHTSLECPPDYRSQAMVIELADYICQKSGVGNSGNPVIADVEAVTSELGMSEDGVESTICKIQEMQSQIEEFFNLIT